MILSKENREKLEQIIDNVVVFDDGNLAFKHHFTSNDGSTIGWYAINR